MRFLRSYNVILRSFQYYLYGWGKWSIRDIPLNQYTFKFFFFHLTLLILFIWYLSISFETIE